jgi:hypothetical protein
MDPAVGIGPGIRIAIAIKGRAFVRTIEPANPAAFPVSIPLYFLSGGAAQDNPRLPRWAAGLLRSLNPCKSSGLFFLERSLQPGDLLL